MIDPVHEANRPPCGGAGTVLSDDVKSLLAPLLAVAGGLGTLFGALKSVAAVLGKTIEELIEGAINLGQLGAVAITPALLAVLAYIALQIAIITIFGTSWRRKCRKPIKGIKTCLTGVVNAVHDATIPPLIVTAKHPHVDLVVKPAYWFEFDRPDRKYVYCSDAGLAGHRSPIVKTFFKSARVCTVLGAAFGGSLLAPLVAIAAFNGIVATTGAATLAGSLAFFAFAILFWLAALIAGLVAGAIAAAATDNDAPDATDLDPDEGDSEPSPGGFGHTTTIAEGDLLTVLGPVAIDGNYRKSLTMRFADNAIVIGEVGGGKASPFSHVDAMEGIPDGLDLCIPPAPRPDPEPEPEPDLPTIPVP